MIFDRMKQTPKRKSKERETGEEGEKELESEKMREFSEVTQMKEITTDCICVPIFHVIGRSGFLSSQPSLSFPLFSLTLFLSFSF